MIMTQRVFTAPPRRLSLHRAGMLMFTSALLLAVLAGCGAGREQAAVADTPGAIAAELAGAAPAGVNPEVWQRLTAEFARVLAQNGTAKRTSAAAAGKGSIVPDLGLHTAGGQSIFHWYYRQHGDYDLNGIVNAADLAPVGINFGKTVLGSEWQKAQLADGDYNGQISVADVAAIGQNFGGRIDGYELQTRPDDSQPWALVAEKPLIPGNPQSGHYPQYTYIGPLMIVGPEFRVVPYTDAAGPRAYGVPSVIYDTKAGLPTRWCSARANSARDGRTISSGPLDAVSTWELMLTAQMQTAFLTEPVTDQYGTIYLGQAANLQLGQPAPGLFTAVSSSGLLLWNVHTLDGIAMAAATNRLGEIVVGDLSGIVYCLSPDGKQLWRRQLSGMCAYGGPLLDDSGVVYILTHAYNGANFTASTLYQLAADGTVAWSRGLNAVCQSSPFYDDVDNVCLLDAEGEFYSWDANGAVVQDYMLPLKPDSSLFTAGAASYNQVFTFAENAMSFRVNDFNNAIGASNSLGTEDPKTMPAVNGLGSFILGSKDSATQSLKLNYYTGGAQVWDIDLPGDFMTNIGIDAADNMYFGTFLQSGGVLTGNGINCVRSDQTKLWFYPTLDYLPLYVTLSGGDQLVCLLAQLSGTGPVKLIGIRGS
jgi:hypothetical protein